MLDTFLATLSPMLVMFIFISVGFAAKKTKIVPDNTATVLSKLENYFIVPALVVNTFMNYCNVESIKSEYLLIVYSVIAIVLAIILSFPLSRLFIKDDYYKRNIYKYALTFANFGFMGNAIVPAILGEPQLYRYMLFTLPLNLVCYSYGVMMLVPKGEKKNGFFKSLFNPIVVSIFVGALIGLTGLTPHIPKFITSAISNCAACMGPLAMILTGFIIGGYDLRSLLSKKKVYVATLMRLVVLPALFIVVLRLLGADNFILVLALFAYATPLGLNTVVFPAAYGGDTSTGASMAMISHTLCIVTIPVMYTLLTAFLEII